MEKTINEYISAVRSILAWKDSPPLAHVRSYGCQLNFSDGEKLKGMLSKMGFGMTDVPDDAEIVIFNTCAVRENAEDRVFGNLGFIKHCKEKRSGMIVGLCGCMASEEHVVKRLERSYPFVDLIFSSSALDKLPKLVYELLSGEKRAVDTGEYNMPVEGLEQLRDSSFKASVPIMFGCNNFCTYCIVPYVRGRERSRRPEMIISEVRELVKKGYKEIMLLGQNVNSYGNDLEESVTFPGLLRALNDIEGDFIIRFMSSHPKNAGKELIDAMLECEKVERHLHLPVQCGSNDVLNRMNRRYTVEMYMETVNYLRSRVPDFSITTDIIVGFPNETEEDFAGTLKLIEEVRFDNIFSFIYSKRSGTKAAEMEDLISDEEKGDRMTRLLALQRGITTREFKRFIGRTLRVLVEGMGKHEGFLTGKCSEALIVEFEGDNSLIGSFVNVNITGSKNWAVTGHIV